MWQWATSLPWTSNSAMATRSRARELLLSRGIRLQYEHSPCQACLKGFERDPAVAKHAARQAACEPASMGERCAAGPEQEVLCGVHIPPQTE